MQKQNDLYNISVVSARMNNELCKMTVKCEKSTQHNRVGCFSGASLIGKAAGLDEIRQKISCKYVGIVAFNNRQIVVGIIGGIAVYDDIVSGEGIDVVTHAVSIFGATDEVAVVAGF